MTLPFQPFAFVELVAPYNKKNITCWLDDIEDITRWREDMNFMFFHVGVPLGICILDRMLTVNPQHIIAKKRKNEHAPSSNIVM